MEVREGLRLYTKYFQQAFGISKDLINYGHCWLWAMGAQRLVGGVLCRTQIEENHAWLLLDGRHYDSDYPGGVKDVQQLEQVFIGMKFCGETGYYHWKTPSAFLQHWKASRFTKDRRRRLNRAVALTRRAFLQEEEAEATLDGSLQMAAGGH
jgi:hypothetical protein